MALSPRTLMVALVVALVLVSVTVANPSSKAPESGLAGNFDALANDNGFVDIGGRKRRHASRSLQELWNEDAHAQGLHHRQARSSSTGTSTSTSTGDSDSIESSENVLLSPTGSR
ncbi:uncharacterized protein LOC143027325 [Oratosquilla oratoria]|uniref:uncharacterized protein LOC143027325 n=1 Tax=Oratosquilla oratoria TaxID=337810 RepID=UPI003F770CF6